MYRIWNTVDICNRFERTVWIDGVIVVGANPYALLTYSMYLLLNLRSPRDYVGPSSCRRRPFALLPKCVRWETPRTADAPSPKSQVMFASAFS